MSPWAKDPIRAEEMKVQARERLLERIRNRDSPRLGKKHDKEAIEKMKIAKQKTRLLKQPQKNIQFWFTHLKQRDIGLVGRDEKGKFVKGHNHPMKTEKLRKKVGESLKGNIPWNKNTTGLYTHSEDTKKKMSLSHIGKNTWSKGRETGRKNIPLSETHKAKLKIARRKRVYPKKDSIPEQMMQLALTLKEIKFEKHKALIGQPDIFIEPNLCIFVDGDFWHANPSQYKADKYMFHGRYAKDIWARDIFVNHELTKQGYNVMRIWVSDIESNIDKCAENIIRLIQNIKGVEIR